MQQQSRGIGSAARAAGGRMLFKVAELVRMRAQSRPRPEWIPADANLIRPRKRIGRIVISGVGQFGLRGKGKVDPGYFFPPFVAELAAAGIETVFATSLEALEQACAADTEVVVVHIYNEDFDETASRLRAFDAAHRDLLIFNRSELGNVIGWKQRTRAMMTKAGVPMPRLAGEAPGLIFSNADHSTGAPVHLLQATEDLDPKRYNTEFIDTRRAFRGQEYHTVLRLLCVGREIVEPSVRARPVSDGSPSVHAGDTPLDPDLLAHLRHELIISRMEELKALAARIGDVLGPGFYAHDFAIEASSGDIHMLETGFKFDNMCYRGRLWPIAGHLPWSHDMFTGVQCHKTAAAFLAECRRFGRFDVARIAPSRTEQVTAAASAAEVGSERELAAPYHTQVGA